MSSYSLRAHAGTWMAPVKVDLILSYFFGSFRTTDRGVFKCLHEGGELLACSINTF